MPADNPEELIINAPRVRKPSMKRRLAVLSDEEDETPKKRRGSTSSKRPKAPSKRARTESSSEMTAATPEPDVDVEGDTPMDVNVDAVDDASTGRSPEPSSSSQPNDPIRRPKAAKEAKSAPKRGGKKRQVVYTDSEDDEDQYTAVPEADSGGSDNEDFTPPKRAKAKTTDVSAAAKSAKSGLSMRGAKRRTTKEDDKPIMMKDESKPKGEAKEERTSPVENTGAKTGLALKTEIGPDPAAASTASPEDPKPPVPPVKRKLPTIKKNKPPAGAPSTSTPVPVRVPMGAIPSKPPAAGGMVGQGSAAQRKPAATVGIADLDLFNANTYAELFNKGASNAPRGGVARRDLDDRRKELDRMRDEARAKREAEAKQCFDLQARAERVAIFEDRLRHMRSRAYLPNFIAGGLWDRYDREERAFAG